MNYLELLAGYNRLGSKLLVRAFIDQNLHRIDKKLLHVALLDFRLYNTKLTFLQNKKVKLDLAKKIKYPGNVLLGDVEGAMLYKHEAIEKDGAKTYYPYGFLKTEDEFNFIYVFNEDNYIKIVRAKTYKLFRLEQPYKTAQEKFARMYDAVKTASKHIDVVEEVNTNGEDQIRLTIVRPESKAYIANCLRTMNIGCETIKGGVLVWSR